MTRPPTNCPRGHASESAYNPNICLGQLEAFVEARDYAGYDPFDALNSPLVRLLTLGTKWGRIGWTQVLRRLPINVRPLLLVPAGHNPKGIGLFLWGYAKRYADDRQPEGFDKIERLLTLLNDHKSTGYHGNCWGYNFDWQSRAAFVPRNTPTIVNSSFIGHALLDTFQYTGNQAALDLALPIADFLLKDLKRKREDDTFCFSYTPIDDNYVHNANMLGASILVRLYQHTRERRLLDAAHSSLAYSMNHQHADGSWFYAQPKMQNWIDSFHTGFNLQALRYFLQAGEATEYHDAYDRGVEYYAERFFLSDGTPKYYHDRTYPLDIHAPTQAIAFFAGEGQK
ncbi:MAG: beta-L-arabinofuranosidase domain-containing protein, partial [Pirellulaceae bacterium]